MRTVGIVAEFDPFHNGHAYIIKKAKELSGADYCIIVMSGAFTQRGTPAYMYKYDRVRSALDCGADAVFELPVSYATASAEAFAYGAVSILNSFGITDAIAFGSECGDMGRLQRLARILCSDDPKYASLIGDGLKKGLTYPAARAEALPEYEDILSSPNDILATEYLKALDRLDSGMVPYCVKRIGSGYHDDKLCEYASAKAIRESTDELSRISESVPECVYDIMLTQHNKTFPIFHDDLTLLAEHAIITGSINELSSYQDMNEDLSNRMTGSMPEMSGRLSDAIKTMRTKELTYSRISRAVLHCILRLKDLTRDEENRLIPCPYTRVLGFNRNASELMRAISDRTEIPVINKAASAASLLSEKAFKYFVETVQADRLYDRIVKQKYGTCLTDTYRISPIIRKTDTR